MPRRYVDNFKEDGTPNGTDSLLTRKWLAASEAERKEMSDRYFRLKRADRNDKIISSIVLLGIVAYVFAGVIFFPKALLISIAGVVILGCVIWALTKIWE